jgi:SAM-dependent methyltransferase
MTTDCAESKTMLTDVQETRDMNSRDETGRIAEETRKIYLEQHKNYVDDVIFNRFLEMRLDPGYYHLEKQDFRGMLVLDAGCGNTGFFQVAMHRLGAGHIHCLDIGEDWIPLLKRITRDHGVPESFLTCTPGTTVELPYEDGTFDFVASNGVLVHLATISDGERAFSELARVAKPGGYLYLSLGAPGGLFEGYIFPALRRAYRELPEFKRWIDDLSPRTFAEIADVVSAEMDKHTGQRVDPVLVSELFDLDLCTFFKNVLQAPRRHILEMNREWTSKQYEKNGFGEMRICVKFIKRKNVRKFLAPLHYRRDLQISKILYGDGYLECIARKKV